MVSLQGILLLILASEIALSLLFSIPWPTGLQNRLLRYIAASKVFANIKYALAVLFAIVSIQMLESMREQSHIWQKKLESPSMTHHDHEHLNSRLFRAQRNAYIDAGVLLFAGVLYEIVREVRHRIRLQLELNAMKKQMDDLSKQHMTVTTERDDLQAERDVLMARCEILKEDLETEKNKRAEVQPGGVVDTMKIAQGASAEDNTLEGLRRRNKTLETALDNAAAQREQDAKTVEGLEANLQDLQASYEHVLREKGDIGRQMGAYQVLLGSESEAKKVL